jgi:hypothetical protein
MPLTDFATGRRISLGELGRMIHAQGKTLEDIQAGVEKRPKWADVERLEKNRDQEQEKQDQAIKDLEDNQKFTTRTVIGAVIAAVGAILTAAAPLVNR